MTISIELFSSPACGKCDQVKKKLQKIADKSGGTVDFSIINILEQMDYALELGILSTPSIAINGKLEFIGLPPMDKLQQILDRESDGEKECHRVFFSAWQVSWDCLLFLNHAPLLPTHCFPSGSTKR